MFTCLISASAENADAEEDIMTAFCHSLSYVLLCISFIKRIYQTEIKFKKRMLSNGVLEPGVFYRKADYKNEKEENNRTGYFTTG